MTTLTIKNPEGTVFLYSIEGSILNIKVTKGEVVNHYKAIRTNKIKDGKLAVYREDNSRVNMPVFEAKKVTNFKDGRKKVSFTCPVEASNFKNDNNCGETWQESNSICMYLYS